MQGTPQAPTQFAALLTHHGERIEGFSPLTMVLGPSPHHREILLAPVRTSTTSRPLTSAYKFSTFTSSLGPTHATRSPEHDFPPAMALLPRRAPPGLTKFKSFPSPTNYTPGLYSSRCCSRTKKPISSVTTSISRRHRTSPAHISPPLTMVPPLR